MAAHPGELGKLLELQKTGQLTARQAARLRTIRNQPKPAPGSKMPGTVVKEGAGVTSGTANITNQQQDISKTTAIANAGLQNAGQEGDLSTTTWEQDPVTGKMTQKIVSSEANKKALQAGQGLYQQGVAGATNVLSGLTGSVGTAGMMDPNSGVSQISKAIYAANTRGLEDRYGQEKEQLAQQLANQGNGPGTPAYETRMKNFEQGYAQQREDAQNMALSQATGQLATQADIAGSMSNLGTGYQAPQAQQYQSTAMQTPDLAGTAYQQGSLANQAAQTAMYGKVGMAGAAANMLGAQSQFIAANKPNPVINPST